MITALYAEDPGGEPISRKKIQSTLAQFKNHPATGTLIIAETEYGITAYAIVVYYWSNEHGGNIAIIDELYVKPEWRNKGLGQKIINYVLDKEKGKSLLIQLEASPANQRALDFYRRLGFSEVTNRTLRKNIL